MLTETFILQIVTLLCGGIAYLVQLWRESRARKWAIEDEQRKVREAKAERDEQAAKAKAERDELLAQMMAAARRQAEREGLITRREVRRVHKELSANTQVNVEALTEANRINLKLIEITHALRVGIATTDPATADRLAEIEKTARALDDARHEREAAEGANAEHAVAAPADLPS